MGIRENLHPIVTIQSVHAIHFARVDAKTQLVSVFSQSR